MERKECSLESQESYSSPHLDGSLDIRAQVLESSLERAQLSGLKLQLERLGAEGLVGLNGGQL